MKRKKPILPRDVSNRVFFGHDSRDLGHVLPKQAFVNAIITSPPYYNLKDYGHRGQIGYGAKNVEAYLKDLDRVFEQCYDLLRDDGTLWLVSDSLKDNGALLPLPFILADRLKKFGWILQDVVIWKKDKTLPFSAPGRFRSLFEYIHVYSKTKSFKFRAHRVSERHKDESRLYEMNGGEARYLRGWPERYSTLGANPGDVWDFPIPVQGTWKPHRDNGTADRIHFCPFPQELVARMISIATDVGDYVLDPFAGSGSVAAQAELMHRQFVGVEINTQFREAYRAVRENFRRTWEAGEEKRQLEEEDRVEEGNLILRLRQLKHASVWGQLIAASLQTSKLKLFKRKKPKLKALVTIGRAVRKSILSALRESPTPKGPAYPVDVFLAFENFSNAPKLKSIAEVLLGERSLRKYGLKITTHVLAATEVTPQMLRVMSDDKLYGYPIKRFYQSSKTLSAAQACKLIRDERSGGLSQFFSDIQVSLGHKTNVIEEAVRRFVGTHANKTISKLGGKSNAAEFLGVTRGELSRLLERARKHKSHRGPALSQILSQ